MLSPSLLSWIFNAVRVVTYVVLFILLLRLLPARFPRYTLRHLLVVMTLIALSLGLFSWLIQK